MAQCYECRKDVPEGVFRCDSCLQAITEGEKTKLRRGLTDWEALKLSFYKSDKKWEDNIKSREMKIVNGKPMPFYRSRGQLIPMPTSRKNLDGNYR